MGGLWTPFQQGFGWSGPSLGHFWAPLGQLLQQIVGKKMFRAGLRGSKKPVGSIFNQFGEGLGKIIRALWIPLVEIGCFSGDK